MRSLLTLIITVLITTQSALAAPQSKAMALKLNEQGVAALQSNDLATAEKLLLQAHESDPANITVIFNLAGAYIANKKEKAAIQLLEDVVKYHQQDAGLYARLGDAYFSSEDIKNARTAYEKAYDLDKTIPNLAIKLGTLYSFSQNLNRAEQMFKAAVEISPKNAGALASLSTVLLANNKPEEAIAAAKKSLQHKVDDEVYITLGSAYETLKNRADALIAYEKALALGNSSKELKSKIDQLKKRTS